jgi:hypothetical protein
VRPFAVRFSHSEILLRPARRTCGSHQLIGQPINLVPSFASSLSSCVTVIIGRPLVHSVCKTLSLLKRFKQVQFAIAQAAGTRMEERATRHEKLPIPNGFVLTIVVRPTFAGSFLKDAQSLLSRGHRRPILSCGGHLDSVRADSSNTVKEFGRSNPKSASFCICARKTEHTQKEGSS